MMAANDLPTIEEICAASWLQIMIGGHGKMAVQVDRNSIAPDILRITLYSPEKKSWITSYTVEQNSDLIFCEGPGDAARCFLGQQDISAY